MRKHAKTLGFSMFFFPMGFATTIFPLDVLHQLAQFFLQHLPGHMSHDLRTDAQDATRLTATRAGGK